MGLGTDLNQVKQRVSNIETKLTNISKSIELILAKIAEPKATPTAEQASPELPTVNFKTLAELDELIRNWNKVNSQVPESVTIARVAPTAEQQRVAEAGENKAPIYPAHAPKMPRPPKPDEEYLPNFLSRCRAVPVISSPVGSSHADDTIYAVQIRNDVFQNSGVIVMTDKAPVKAKGQWKCGEGAKHWTVYTARLPLFKDADHVSARYDRAMGCWFMTDGSIERIMVANGNAAAVIPKSPNCRCTVSAKPYKWNALPEPKGYSESKIEELIKSSVALALNNPANSTYSEISSAATENIMKHLYTIMALASDIKF